MTPAQMRDLARRIRETAEARARQLEAAARLIERADASPLSPGHDYDTIGTMEPGQSYRLVKKGLHRGPVLRSKGPVATVAKELSLSMRGLALKIGVPYEALKKQDARGSVTEDVRAKLEAAQSEHSALAAQAAEAPAK